MFEGKWKYIKERIIKNIKKYKINLLPRPQKKEKFSSRFFLYFYFKWRGWDTEKNGCVMLLFYCYWTETMFCSLTLSFNNKLCVGINCDERYFSKDSKNISLELPENFKAQNKAYILRTIKLSKILATFSVQFIAFLIKLLINMLP